MKPSRTITMSHGMIGLAEEQLPPSGLEGVAVWPIVGSSQTRRGAGAIARIRRHVAWWSMRRHALEVDRLVLVDPPRWARMYVKRQREHASLSPARELGLDEPLETARVGAA